MLQIVLALTLLLSLSAAEHKAVIPSNGAKPGGPYSPGIIAGNHLYVAGQGPRSSAGIMPDDFPGQARQSLENVKAIVEAAASQAHVVMQAKYDALNPMALKQLVGAGTKLRPFPKDVMNAAFKAAMGLYEEISAKNENWKKIYADYSKFRADQNLWFRFTEASFDKFMQEQKL